jgi:hypothetical protein
MVSGGTVRLSCDAVVVTPLCACRARVAAQTLSEAPRFNVGAAKGAQCGGANRAPRRPLTYFETLAGHVLRASTTLSSAGGQSFGATSSTAFGDTAKVRSRHTDTSVHTHVNTKLHTLAVDSSCFRGPRVGSLAVQEPGKAAPGLGMLDGKWLSDVRRTRHAHVAVVSRADASWRHVDAQIDVKKRLRSVHPALSRSFQLRNARCAAPWLRSAAVSVGPRLRSVLDSSCGAARRPSHVHAVVRSCVRVRAWLQRPVLHRRRGGVAGQRPAEAAPRVGPHAGGLPEQHCAARAARLRRRASGGRLPVSPRVSADGARVRHAVQPLPGVASVRERGPRCRAS